MDFTFSAACYIVSILLVCWLRYAPSQPQASTQPTPTVEPMTETSEISQTLETKPEAPAIADPWETPVTPIASTRRWVAAKSQSVKPVLALCPAKEVKPVESVEAVEATELEIDLNSLDAGKLRKLCSEYKIQWRDVRGKNRHATKAMMVAQLEAKVKALQATA